MRKNALTICCFTCAAGAIGAFCRWLQNQTAFDAAGLSKAGIFNVIMPLVILIAAACFLFQILRLEKSGLIYPGDFQSAYRSTTKLYTPIVWILGVMMIIGAVSVFYASSSGTQPILLRVLAALSLFSGIFFPLLAMSAHRQTAAGLRCLFASLPVIQFCFWLITSYKINSTNPTVWAYAVEIIAICAALLAFYYAAGYAFGRIKARNTVFFCMLGAFFCLVCLADDRSFGLQLMTVSAAGMLLFNGWMILSNMRPAPQPEDEPDEPPAPIRADDIGSILNEFHNDADE